MCVRLKEKREKLKGEPEREKTRDRLTISHTDRGDFRHFFTLSPRVGDSPKATFEYSLSLMFKDLEVIPF